jgi:hypothetical protein
MSSSSSRMLPVFVLLVGLGVALPTPWATDFPNITCSPVGRGLSARVPRCTPALPCVHLLSTYASLGITTINISDFGENQVCSTRIGTAAVDARNDGPTSSITVDGEARYFCKFEPPGTALPLLIDFPGSGGFARVAWSETRFRQKAETEVLVRSSWNRSAVFHIVFSKKKKFFFDFSFFQKVGTTGYLFVSMSPLNRHWPPSGLLGSDEDSAKQDFLYRNYSDNEDVRFVDELINSFVSRGKVDPNYVFLTGHSNGAQFAHFYGIVRAGTLSPYGHRPAAVSAFSGADPFGAVGGDINCALSSGGISPGFNYPQARNLPILLLGAACDLVSCSAQQLFINNVAPNVVGISSNVSMVILDDNHNRVFVCDSNCSSTRARTNHGNRPISWEPAVLEFFRSNPLQRTSSTTSPGSTRPGIASVVSCSVILAALSIFV